jgi:hypothetical protein
MALTPRLVVFTVVASLGYLGLAILGWGGFTAFFSHPALVALAIVGVVLSGVALFSGGNLSPGEREDRGNRWVLAAFGVIGLLMAYLPAYTDRNDFWTLDGDAVRWLGVVLFAVGGALRIWPVFVLGRRFSGLVAIQPGLRGRRAAHGAAHPAAACAHASRRAVAAHALRRRVRCLPLPHVAAHSGHLLAGRTNFRD